MAATSPDTLTAFAWLTSWVSGDVGPQHDVLYDIVAVDEQRRQHFCAALVGVVALLADSAEGGNHSFVVGVAAKSGRNPDLRFATFAVNASRSGDTAQVADIVEMYASSATECARFCQIVAECGVEHLHDIAERHETSVDTELSRWGLLYANPQ